MKKITSDKAPQAIGPYSQAISVNGLLFLSGQIPLVPETGALLDGGIEAQTRLVIANIENVLAAAGCTASDVIKTTCFLTDMNDFAVFNEIYGEFFAGKPARSCVAVSALPKGALVEIETIAQLPEA